MLRLAPRTCVLALGLIVAGCTEPDAAKPPAGPPAPVADAELKLVDYGFDFQPALTAGRHVVRVENAAQQPHEVFIARLEPGRSAPELLDWIMKQQGPPPAVPMGGTTVLAPGVVNYLTLDLAPGRYALYCFVPDARDGKEHVAHGMIREIEVR